MKNDKSEPNIDYVRGYKKYHLTEHWEEYIRVVEGSKTAILFCHCMVGSPKFFNDYIDLIPEDWSIYNILLEGLGGSIDYLSTTSMDAWKEQMNSEYEKLAEKYEHIIILAHSMGALFAIDLANRYPEKIKGVFLLAPPLNAQVTPNIMRTAMRMFQNKITDEDVVGCMAKEVFSIEVTPKVYRYLKCYAIYIDILREIFRVRKKINQLKVPTQVVLSKHDEFVRVSTKAYFSGMENVRLQTLEKSRHFCYEKSEYEMVLGLFTEFCSAVI